MNWRIIKESFPMVVSSLVGGNAEWKGMDDMTPFWQTRRIMQDLPPHVHKTWSPATCSPPLNSVRSALSPSLSMFCVPVFLVPALLVCLLLSLCLTQDCRLSVVHGVTDVRSLICDHEGGPKSPEWVGSRGGPDALFLQYLQYYFLQVTPTYMPNLMCAPES